MHNTIALTAQNSCLGRRLGSYILAHIIRISTSMHPARWAKTRSPFMHRPFVTPSLTAPPSPSSPFPHGRQSKDNCSQTQTAAAAEEKSSASGDFMWKLPVAHVALALSAAAATAAAPDDGDSDVLGLISAATSPHFPDTHTKGTSTHLPQGLPSEWMAVWLLGFRCHLVQAATKCKRRVAIPPLSSPVFNYSEGLERPSKSQPACALRTGATPLLQQAVGIQNSRTSVDF